MQLSDFDYQLPQTSIAQIPANPRDTSKLLILDKKQKTIEHTSFLKLPSKLRSGDVLITNNSKVIPARLQARKKSGGTVEVLVIRKIDETTWEAMVKPGLKVCTELEFIDRHGAVSKITATVLSDEGYTRIIQFSKPLELYFQKIGATPLPPYISSEGKKSSWYQTIFAKHAGSVAAPTASLHFTPRVVKKLSKAGVEMYPITLHVGPGTFLPVKTENITEHKMHAEWASIPKETVDAIRKAKAEGRRVISVGTTATRTLEYFAKQLLTNTSPHFNTPSVVVLGLDPGIHSSLQRPIAGWVDLFIYPGYKFKIIDGMLTNFHLPKSTLIMLASALAGQDFIKKAYYEAIENNYRFYSFGDAMLIL